jgi:hypothetical protein
MRDLHGRRLIWHGSWHGDWTQRSMSTVDRVLYVSDWQHARDGVPLGLDLIHFAFESASRRRRSAEDASRLAIRRSARPLRALGVPRDDDALLAACHLAELLARAEEGRRHGTPLRPGMLEDLRAGLRRWVARA